jgi:hypothetical protein
MGRFASLLLIHPTIPSTTLFASCRRIYIQILFPYIPITTKNIGNTSDNISKTIALNSNFIQKGGKDFNRYEDFRFS